jgi:hypothetical protein
LVQKATPIEFKVNEIYINERGEIPEAKPEESRILNHVVFSGEENQKITEVITRRYTS